MIRFIADVVRLYRGERVEERSAAKKAEVAAKEGVAPDWNESFPKSEYRDVPGLCKVASIKEIEGQGWSLNPGRYVGVTGRVEDDFDFKERLEELNEELELLNVEARELEEQISENVARLQEF